MRVTLPEIFRAATLVAIALILGLACGPQKAEPATAFTLMDSNGQQVKLTQLLEEHDAVVVVFYRGFA